MLKVYVRDGEPEITEVFEEFPNEVTVALNISNCIGMCEECSEPWLREDSGRELPDEFIQEILDEHQDSTVFGLMGGDSDHEDVKRIADYVHKHSNMKVGIYSGLEYLDLDLVPYIDLYKIGRWIPPKGKVAEWWKTNCGPLVFPFSNQLLFEKIGNKLVNVTSLFRKNPLNDLERYIIK